MLLLGISAAKRFTLTKKYDIIKAKNFLLYQKKISEKL